VSHLAWQPLSAQITAAAARAGFDLVLPFGLARYNAAAPELERLADLGRPNALGILFGNTRQLWPVFTRAFAEEPEVSSAAQPLDTYVVQRLRRILAGATQLRHELTFSHVTQPRAFPIQRLAERIGLAALSPSHLLIHPLYGPWLALRAIAVIDLEGPSDPPPLPERPCQNCSAPCVSALEHALAASGTPLTSAAVVAHADAWIAVRDACPVGPSARYGPNQLAYHYGTARALALPDA
jgi:hypothetical protein